MGHGGQSLRDFSLVFIPLPRKGFKQERVLVQQTHRTVSHHLKMLLRPTPALGGKGIGMGYVKQNFKTPGTELHIQIRKKAVPATVIKLPFYKG